MIVIPDKAYAQYLVSQTLAAMVQCPVFRREYRSSTTQSTFIQPLSGI